MLDVVIPTARDVVVEGRRWIPVGRHCVDTREGVGCWRVVQKILEDSANVLIPISNPGRTRRTRARTRDWSDECHCNVHAKIACPNRMQVCSSEARLIRLDASPE